MWSDAPYCMYIHTYTADHLPPGPYGLEWMRCAEVYQGKFYMRYGDISLDFSYSSVYHPTVRPRMRPVVRDGSGKVGATVDYRNTELWREMMAQSRSPLDWFQGAGDDEDSIDRKETIRDQSEAAGMPDCGNTRETRTQGRVRHVRPRQYAVRTAR